MSDLDLNGLREDVRDIIVQTVYMRHGPAPIMGAATPNYIEKRKQAAIDEYRNNQRFRTVVDIMTSAITRAVENRHK